MSWRLSSRHIGDDVKALFALKVLDFVIVKFVRSESRVQPLSEKPDAGEEA